MNRVRGWGLFIGGILVGACGLHLLYRGSGVAPSEAQRRALAILDHPPVAIPIGNNPVVAASHHILPAVVSIDTIGRIRQQNENGKSVLVEQEVRGKGSGVVFSPDGYIVTNDHVIDGALRIRVTFADGEWRFAHLIGRDQDRDLAVLRVDRINLTSAELGDSDKLQVGETVLAVGNPMGLGASVTTGIVSGLNRHNLQVDSSHNLDGAIQTDAAINRGNSGGALTNIHGQLIGINTAILSAEQNGGSIGLGFALPINIVRTTVRRIIASTPDLPVSTHKLWLGVRLRAISADESVAYGLPATKAIRIDHVLPETPASVAGVEAGDILLRAGNTPLHSPQDVANLLSHLKSGDHCLLHLFRPHEQVQKDLQVTVQEHP